MTVGNVRMSDLAGLGPCGPRPRTVPPDATTGSPEEMPAGRRAEESPETSCEQWTPRLGHVTWRGYVEAS